MTKFNQDKFESDAKKLVAKYLNYKVNEEDVSIFGFSKVGANAKAMLSSVLDHCYFEVTYFGEEGKYKVDVYDITDVVWGLEKGITVKPTRYRYPKVQVSAETKCPVCQEHHDILGLTDILLLKNASVHIGRGVQGLPKGTFKIKYCPFCGRKL